MVYAHTSHTHNAEGRRICWAQEFATILDNTVRPPQKKREWRERENRNKMWTKKPLWANEKIQGNKQQLIAFIDE